MADERQQADTRPSPSQEKWPAAAEITPEVSEAGAADAAEVTPEMIPEECDGIVITAEMIAAGTAVLASYNEDYDRIEDAVRWIYEAMEDARRHPNSENQR